jgi:hypothetical protein
MNPTRKVNWQACKIGYALAPNQREPKDDPSVPNSSARIAKLGNRSRKLRRKLAKGVITVKEGRTTEDEMNSAACCFARLNLIPSLDSAQDASHHILLLTLKHDKSNSNKRSPFCPKTRYLYFRISFHHSKQPLKLDDLSLLRKVSTARRWLLVFSTSFAVKSLR